MVKNQIIVVSVLNRIRNDIERYLSSFLLPWAHYGH
jgi:hypothetical protein